MKYLLDTDTCSFIMRQSSTTLMQRFDGIPGDVVAMSVITQGELSAGLARKPLATQLKARFTQLHSAIPTLDLPAEAAAHYASIRAHLESKGLVIGTNDLWIASHALAADMTLVTNNVREFKRVPKLKVENWLEA
jgi:tRNA(fMet)-specific endonuclease VapC